MKTTAFCPISNNKIDENVARFNAAITVVLLTLFILTSSVLPLAFLLVDFALRGAELSAYSPLALFSKRIVSTLGIKPKSVNAGPKIFAARIGIVFSLASLLFHLLGLAEVSLIIASIFALCALLEAVFSFCVACQIYPFVYRFSLKFSK